MLRGHQQNLNLACNAIVFNKHLDLVCNVCRLTYLDLICLFKIATAFFRHFDGMLSNKDIKLVLMCLALGTKKVQVILA